MYQTFYIDVGEEVTSIIDRLRRSKAQENILVIPKRALVFQSVVNLKLLQKESERMGRDITVVTSDEHGIQLAERLGVSVQTSFDGMEDQTELREDFQPQIAQKRVNSAFNNEQKNSDRTIGSNDFFDASNAHLDEDYEYVQPVQSAGDKQEKQTQQYPRSATQQSSNVYTQQFNVNSGYQRTPNSQKENMPNRNFVSDSPRRVVQAQRSSADMVSDLRRMPSRESQRVTQQPMQKRQLPSQGDYFQLGNFNSVKHPGYPSRASDQSAQQVQIKRVGAQNYNSNSFQMPGYGRQEGFLGNRPSVKFQNRFSFLNKKKEKSVNEEVYVSRGIKTKLLGFGLICALVIVIIGVYLFLPKASITILASTYEWNTELEIKSNPSIMAYDSNNFVLPTHLVEIELEKRENYPATGEGAVSDEKAKGKITIHNEFSTAPQSLVATTRFVSEDGKIFRLKDNIAVPGTQTVNGEIKPGVIEADVIADEAGTDYNIKPGKFTIPGFKGGPKYEKFYGVSQKAMMGGGTAGSNLRVVSREDIINAKKSLESQVAEELRIQLDDEISVKGEILVPELSREVVIDSDSSIFEGVATENFEYVVKIKLQALVFAKSDIESLLFDVYQRRNEDLDGLKMEFEGFEYSNAQVNFDTKVLNVDVSVSAKVYPEVKLEQLRADLLGKNDKEIKEVMDKYPMIQEVEISLWPEIIVNKIPNNSSRVELELKYL